MKKTFYILLLTFTFYLLPLNCFSQWLQQTSGVTSPLLDIDFINPNTGWTCGDNGVILKTTNGGTNWFQQSSGVFKALWGIEAVDSNIIWCVGQWNTILKTTDGGNNWIVMRDGPTSTPNFYKAFFLNANTGWMLKNNYILRTTNGGISFDSTNTVYTFLWDIFFKDASTGVLCGNGSRILKSTDGGAIWNEIVIPIHNFGRPDFYRLSFVGNTGWVVAQGSSFGLGKLVYRTTDFGSSWDTIGRVLYPIGEENYSVFFSSLNTGYCGGTGGYIFKTTNGGFNWIQQSVPINGYRGDFYFTNDTNGWVVGGGGYILNTTNGGTYVGIEPISNTIPFKHNIKNIFPNPFNPVTNIEFEIAYNDDVEIIIYDMLGKKVSVLVNEKLKPGIYKVTFNGENLSSGIYFCRLITSGSIISKTIVLIK